MNWKHWNRRGNAFRHAVSHVLLWTSFSLMVISPQVSLGQESTAFQPYKIRHGEAAMIAKRVEAVLQPGSEVLPDPANNRILVRATQGELAQVQQVIQTLDQPSISQSTTQLSEAADTVMRSYPVRSEQLEQIGNQLRQRFANDADTKIGIDSRNSRILVQGTAQVQDQVMGLLAPNRQNRPAPRSTSTTNRAPRRSSAPRPLSGQQGSDSVRLKQISWQQLVSAFQGMTPNKLTLRQDDQSNSLLLALPSKQGQTNMQINPDTNSVTLDGPVELVQSWTKAAQVLDQMGTEGNLRPRMVPIENVSPETISRAVYVLQNALNQQQAETDVRWSGDLLGIKAPDEGRTNTGFTAIQSADGSNQLAFQNQPPNGTTPDAANPANADNAPGQEPIGVEGGMTGPVSIEYVEGMDALIIKGRPQDVERIMGIVEQLEAIAEETQPDIQIVPLQHVNSTSMAELVTQLNSSALEVRQGPVNITALVKPNALLLIGRPEGVKSTIDLITRLDQPVAPESQFNTFRLKHMPATTAQQTVQTFFEERGGLGPRIQVEADFRTNSLIVYASPRDMAEVGYLLEKIDVDESEAVSEVRVFKLQNALAEEVAPVLQNTLQSQGGDTTGAQGGGAGQGAAPGAAPAGNAAGNAAGGQAGSRSAMLRMAVIDAAGKRLLKSGILTDVRVSADTRANSLVVTAPPESMDLIAALVKQLDQLPTAESAIKVFTIVNGDASTLVTMLNQLFGQATATGGVQGQQPNFQTAGGADGSLVPMRFTMDIRTNSIIATGSNADLAVVEAILLRLDQDDVSNRIQRVYRLLNAPAQDVATAINSYLQNERVVRQSLQGAISSVEVIEREVIVVAETVSNSLIISSTPRYFQQVAEIIAELDARPPMVMVQVVIAQVDLNNVEELGVELGIQDSLLFDRSVVTGGVADPGFNFNNQALGNALTNPAGLVNGDNVAGQALSNFAVGRSGDLGYGGLVLSASNESVSVLIRALQETRRLDVLSRPQIMTLNNQPAYILVGQRVPRITSSQIVQAGTINNTDLENVGLSLGVTPRISPDGLVVMEIDAEKSELAPESQGIPISINANGDVIRSPIINATAAQTTVSARSGQTIVLGGLITKTRSLTDRRVPFLGDLPLLGPLFRYDNTTERRTELLIIMTPYIVQKPEDAEWLNQIESQRMSWCLADVADIHGPGHHGLTSKCGSDAYLETEVVYPDRSPGAMPMEYEIDNSGSVGSGLYEVMPQFEPGETAPEPTFIGPQASIGRGTSGTSEPSEKSPRLFGWKSIKNLKLKLGKDKKDEPAEDTLLDTEVADYRTRGDQSSDRVTAASYSRVRGADDQVMSSGYLRQTEVNHVKRRPEYSDPWNTTPGTSRR
ncbi:MAG: secretin N-terminal domain-containing protein [Pirellulaceae bacterium]